MSPRFYVTKVYDLVDFYDIFSHRSYRCKSGVKFINGRNRAKPFQNGDRFKLFQNLTSGTNISFWNPEQQKKADNNLQDFE